jgi:O-antigen ligase
MRNGAYLISLVFIFMIPWEGVLEFPGLGTGTRVLGLLMASIWFVSVFFTNKFRKPQLFHILVLLFVLWNTISIFWSAEPRRSVDQVITWTLLLGLTFIIWDLYRTPASLLAGLQVYILGTFIAIGSAIYNFLIGNAFYSNYERFSPGGTNPDGFGFIIALGIPVAWYLATSKNTNISGGLLKFVNYAFIPAAFFGLALSGTRTAMIAAIPGMIFGLTSLARLRIWARIAIFMFLLIVILILLPVVQPLKSFERFSTTTDALAQGDLNERTIIWRDGIEAFAERPIFGVGANMFRSVNSLGKVAHNTFISVMIELGLIGLIMFVVILTIVVIQAWSLPKWDKSFWLSLLLVWAIGASSLTWEYRKTTWLFLNMIVASAALHRYRERMAGAFALSNDLFANPNLATAEVNDDINFVGSAELFRYSEENAAAISFSSDLYTNVYQPEASQIDVGEFVIDATQDEDAVEKLDGVDDFCPNQICPDVGKVQTKQQKNLIRYGKSKTGQQQFKCKTCQHTFTQAKGNEPPSAGG